MALDLWRLGKVRHSRLAEFPSAPSPRELFYAGSPREPPLRRCRTGTTRAPRAPRGRRCRHQGRRGVLEAASRLKEQWRIVAPALPPHWRASGDASLANMGTWAAAALRHHYREPRPSARLRPKARSTPARRAPRAARDDTAGSRVVARHLPADPRERATEGPLVVEPPEPARLVPAVLAGPGAVVRPRRPPVQPRRFREE